MIKECKVVLWNKYVMVIDFDSIQVQMPSTDKKENTLYVKYENRNYFLVTKEEYEKSLVKYEKTIGKVKSDNDKE